MKLGAFSVSLNVKNLSKSIAFYECLGFQRFGGSDEHKYAIMKNADTVIGLFEGMFEENMLTFNPGWSQSAEPVDPFDDVRDIKRSLSDAEVPILHEQGAGEGPASFVVIDPDGNPILIDQHR